MRVRLFGGKREGKEVRKSGGRLPAASSVPRCCRTLLANPAQLDSYFQMFIPQKFSYHSVPRPSMKNLDIAKILNYGVSGLGFLLAFLAYRLLNNAQRQGLSNSYNIRIYVFMGFSVVLCVLGLIAPLISPHAVASEPTLASGSGPLTNTKWDIEEGEYNEEPVPKVIPYSLSANIKQSGQHVTAKLVAGSKAWDAEGYYNPPFLTLSYISAVGTSGLGSYTLKETPDGRLAFYGYWLGVECKGNNPRRQILMKCPVVFIQEDHLDLKSKYRYHLYGNGEKVLCEDVVLEPEQTCSVQTQSPHP